MSATNIKKKIYIYLFILFIHLFFKVGGEPVTIVKSQAEKSHDQPTQAEMWGPSIGCLHRQNVDRLVRIFYFIFLPLKTTYILQIHIV